MPKLTDPDSLTLAVNTSPTTQEVSIDTGGKTIELRVAGNLDDTAPGKTSGVTGRCLYSFLKEEWLVNSTLRRFRFPIQMIFEGSFIVTNGWTFFNQQSRDLIRDAGFNEVAASNIYACMISLGDMDDPGADLAYYIQTQSFTASTNDYDKTGELNENVAITGFTSYFKTFLREQGKTYAEYALLQELGINSITFQAYSFPLTNGPDLKITASDNTIDTTSPYNGMEINYIKGIGFTTWANSTVYPANSVVQSSGGRWFFTSAGGTSSGNDSNLTGGSDSGVTWVTYFGEEQIGTLYYAFNREVDANGGTDIQAHEFMSRQLRQTGDINDNTGIPSGQDAYGTVNGQVARLLSSYVGDTLLLAPGVVLRNFNSNSTNNINHQPITVDSGGLDGDGVPLVFTTVAFPFVSAGNFVFATNIVDEPNNETVYTVYFDYITTTTSTAIAITGASGSTATFDYSASAGLLNFLQNGDYIRVSGFANAVNNGLWLLTGAPSANTFPATKQNGATVVNETAGPSVTVLENPFESPGAVIVNDNSSTPLDGEVTASSIPFDFDYTNNNQGGRTPGTDAFCTLVAIALNGATWTSSSFTITAATGINVPVNPNDELNYVNP